MPQTVPRGRLTEHGWDVIRHQPGSKLKREEHGRVDVLCEEGGGEGDCRTKETVEERENDIQGDQGD
ncbi:hypothetical protein NDU88_006474 [Pleurodeles waltl]|uniref:Uncharacterized protein n=1 Tax=Pleurodeles waltl TaxID=8319 RepID=A0AAV7RQC2_PLEWA|nr:hypothetical protein NDU88_006474 [Pleurodeles waltl]